MPGKTDYVLSYRPEEQERLRGQAEQLGPDFARLSDEIGVKQGQRAVATAPPSAVAARSHN